MDVRTYRAKSIQAALQLVRRDLGPDAAVLHTRQLRDGLLGWLLGGRRIEVTASTTVNVPSRLIRPIRPTEAPGNPSASAPGAPSRIPPAHEQDFRTKFCNDLTARNEELGETVEDLWSNEKRRRHHGLPETLFRLFTDMIDAEVSEDLARELIERVQDEAQSSQQDDPVLLKARIARMIENEIDVTGPIEARPGASHLVALIGPTGVGKTTTIAKLAANYRLRQKRRVGLITVDTYRIAAVEQLRTYADIIDLPMEVVSTPRQMREAVARLSNLDMILMDTAGRSPHDEVQVQELKSMLAEAKPDEVHLVLSSTASETSMIKAASKFAEVGTTALLLTKLDEATGLGSLLPLLRRSRLPLSYVTNGQNVPDDIRPADRRQLAQTVLGMETP